jgi:hypothetical protein
MTSYVNPFTGQTIQPSQVGYEQLTISTDTILEWPVNGNTNDVVANIIEVTASSGTASFYGYISSTTLTVTQVTSGTLAVGQTISGTGITVGTTITALGTGSGGTGTYTISTSQTTGAIITASLSGTTLTVTAISGTLVVGQLIIGTGVTSNLTITAFVSGTGGVGTYTVSSSASGSLGSRSMTASSVITAAPLHLIMPAATQVSTGQSVLITNIGSNAFTVVKSDGSTIVSVPSGIAEYIYLTDNTTIPGTWSSVQFGAGTSAANAAVLAGYGLKAISTTLNQAYTLNTYYSNIAFTSANRAEFAVWQSGVGTFTLPVAADVGNNWFIMVRNNGTGILTISPTGTDTIDGDSNKQLQITESLVLVSNGNGGYNSFGYGQAVSFFFTQLALDVTGLGPTITLSAAQASNLILEFYGTLAANTTVILPPTVQLYTITNNTTGAYTLTFSTGVGGASTVTIAQTQTLIVVCDGTNVYNANSAAISSLPSLTLNPGSAAAPALNFAGNTNTGYYQPSSGQMAWALNGVNKMTLTSAGLAVINGISGGSF